MDENIVSAKNKAIENEGSKRRLQAESEKLRQELDLLRNKYAETQKQMNDSRALVMESRLEYETAKTEVNANYNKLEKLKTDHDTKIRKIRNLASVAETSDMMDDQKSVTVNKNCNLRREPSSESQIVGYLNQGQSVSVAPADSKYFKVLNSSGSPQFLRRTCVEE